MSPSPGSSASGPIRLLVVDDHPVVRSGIVGMFSNEEDLEVVGEAADGLQAVALAVRAGTVSGLTVCGTDPVEAASRASRPWGAEDDGAAGPGESGAVAAPASCGDGVGGLGHGVGLGLVRFVLFSNPLLAAFRAVLDV